MKKNIIALFLSFSLLLIFSCISITYAQNTKEDSSKLEKAMKKMIENDLKGRGITDQRVLTAMKRVLRHNFVDKKFRDVAYSDHPLPIDEGQTISQPYVVALMTESLRIKKGEKVLEIGTGSGYQAAVLGEITDKVYTIEIRERLTKRAKETLIKEGYESIKVKHGDGYFGWREYAPFDAIMITAAANHVPPTLLNQLKEGGRLIIPLGSTTYFQTLTLIEKKKGDFLTTHITGVRFVPMTGEILKRK
ncbi:MAG TPA: protein-L-isoaspartate(D-aspartate) O-methyltransferase [Nitrospinota bacterium]|nr:protein-L-isoaspartate(D-aspartate) O-methyltransferase [Nitrospinota bacterium]